MAQPVDPPGIRVVACDAKVASKKRGICANKLSAEDFRALAPGVSWYYNWHYKTEFTPPSDVKMEFIPQAWGNRPADVEGLDAYLRDAKVKPRVVLAINEPNLKDQAFITPQQTADLMKRIKAVADKYNLPVIGPHMALGSGNDASIKAFDPIDNKEVMYTFFVPFLKATFHYMGNVKPAGLGLHSYGNIHELKWAAEEMHKQFGQPVWMTEYAQWKVKNQDEARDYLIAATDFLEASPNVAGYAWFKERSTNKAISLLEKESGKLSTLGEMYIAIPSHETDVYYRLPGKLQSENYVKANLATLKLTKDSEGGVFDMVPGGAETELSYNVMVDREADFAVTFRAFRGAISTNAIEIVKDGKVIASAMAKSGGAWENVQTTVHLPAGPQTLQIRCAGHMMNWAEFTAGK
ncbi:MAG: glycosyl hydrolase [Candidatus Methylacidiphilales bacterium]|nr:glycosyl hydrolase [Candidatus Methylacidiphilales bacterium]